MRKRRAHPEADFQRALISVLEAALPEGCFLTAIDHSRRGPRQGALLKSMGVKRGIPDVMILVPLRGVYFLECKALKGKLSEEQWAFFGAADRAGCFWHCARDIEVTLQWLRDYGVPLRARLAA